MYSERKWEWTFGSTKDWTLTQETVCCSLYGLFLLTKTMIDNLNF